MPYWFAASRWADQEVPTCVSFRQEGLFWITAHLTFLKAPSNCPFCRSGGKWGSLLISVKLFATQILMWSKKINLCYVYQLELPHWGGSGGYHGLCLEQGLGEAIDYSFQHRLVNVVDWGRFFCLIEGLFDRQRFIDQSFGWSIDGLDLLRDYAYCLCSGGLIRGWMIAWLKRFSKG